MVGGQKRFPLTETGLKDSQEWGHVGPTRMESLGGEVGEI